MKKKKTAWHALLSWLLIALLSLHGGGAFAAALRCAPAAVPPKAAALHVGAQGGHAAHADHGAAHATMQELPAIDGNATHDARELCAAVCAAAALPAAVPAALPPTAIATVRFAAPVLPAASFVRGGPERPPRTA